MKYIIRKPTINKKTKQMSLTIPKKEMKCYNPSMVIDENIMFKIKPIRRLNK